jgi:hypothetical protein
MVHVLHGLARSAADARLAVLMHLSHAEAKAIRASIAERLKRPDAAPTKPLLPIVDIGNAGGY